MATDDEIKAVFIKSALTAYGKKATSAMKRQVLKLKAVSTKDLFDSITYKVTAGGSDHRGRVEIIFKEYGRMVDMGVGKGYKNNRENRRDKLIVQRKPKKIYSPVVYGLITPLLKELQSGYTDSIKNSIKNSLENIPA